MQRIDQVQTFWLLLLILLLFFYFAFIHDYKVKVDDPKPVVQETFQKFDIEQDLARIEIHPEEIQTYKTNPFEAPEQISMSERTPEAWIKFEQKVGQYITQIEMAENLNLKEKLLEYQQVQKAVEDCKKSEIYGELKNQKEKSYYEKSTMYDDKDQRRRKSELELEIFKLETSIKEDNIFINQKRNEEREQNRLLDDLKNKRAICKREEQQVDEKNQQHQRQISDKEQKKLEYRQLIDELRKYDLQNQEKIKLYEQDQKYAQMFLRQYNKTDSRGLNILGSSSLTQPQLTYDNKVQYAFEKGQDFDKMLEKSSPQFKEGLFKSQASRNDQIKDYEIQIQRLDQEIKILSGQFQTASCKTNEYDNQQTLIEGDLNRIQSYLKLKEKEVADNKLRLKDLYYQVGQIKDYQLQEIDNSKQIQASYEILNYYKDNKAKDEQCLAICSKLSQLSEQLKAFQNMKVDQINTKLTDVKFELGELNKSL